MSAAQDLHDPERAQRDSQWLYRQGDLVLGPLTGQQLVDKLYAGALTGDTEVSCTGPSGFRKLKELTPFQLHVAQAVVRLRVEAEAREARARLNQQRIVTIGVVLGVLIALGLGAWQVSRYAKVYLAANADSGLDIQVDPPVITLAKRSLPEELFEYPGEPKRTPVRPPDTTSDKTDKTEKPEKVASVGPKPERPAKAGRVSGKVSTDPDGLATEVNYDLGAINRVVKSNQSTLHHCFKEESERRPGFAAKVPLEFTIGNDGRVAQLWIDNPQLKKGALFECLFTELKKWPFKAYTGERATVNLAFTIGKKG
ncbi:AgmX/PglI C-terminal domain-containing protein [Melittangium boletus]|uniref:GYF domain-containing protein n=1 Tax=Melittangium boletus DSM 14713 TaxID=1294270 RepID=A0A250IP31_9BACT|nr:AgmX/PglI C-terminal domain-containing protein [Melittangium boletus]ATB32941.1 hypothetical protein MEBOL_006430 [Melittangium boletus DSM 14713]